MKVVIANAVLAGLAIADRLNEMGLSADAVLQEQVGELATELAGIMQAVELVDKAVGVVANAYRQGEVEAVTRGLTVIKQCTSELVSEQERIEAAMGTPEEFMLLQLLQALAGAR